MFETCGLLHLGRSHVSFRQVAQQHFCDRFRMVQLVLPLSASRICYLKYNTKLLSCRTDPNPIPYKWKFGIDVIILVELTSSPLQSKQSSSKESWPCIISPLRRNEWTQLPKLWHHTFLRHPWEYTSAPALTDHSRWTQQPLGFQGVYYESKSERCNRFSARTGQGSEHRLLVKSNAFY